MLVILIELTFYCRIIKENYMQALILAGGKGTRLKPLTNNIPKSIVPVGNRPFLERQIQLLKKIGISDIILSLNYQPAAIKKILGDGSALGVRLSYSIESVPMGTAGAYKFAEKSLKSTTVVLNGDILTDIDLGAVIEQHKKYNSTATIVLTKVENPSAYGLVEVGEDSQVLRFLEKPSLDDSNRLKINTINAGIYILEPRVLGFVPAGEKYSFEYQLFPDLLRQKEKFRAFTADDAYWLDIGTPQRYLQANRDLLNGRIKNLQINRNGNFKISSEAEIDDASLIAEGCVIKRRAKIINSVLGKDVVVEEHAIIRDSVIWSGTRINSHTNVLDSIVGNNCQIGKNVSLTSGSVLSDDSFLKDFTCY